MDWALVGGFLGAMLGGWVGGVVGAVGLGCVGAVLGDAVTYRRKP